MGKKVRHTHPPIEKYVTVMICCFIFAIIDLIYSHFLNMLIHLNLPCANSLSLSCKYFFFSSLDTLLYYYFHFLRSSLSTLTFSDVVLGETTLGPKTGSETGRAHWAAAMAKPGIKVFMWHCMEKSF